MRKFLLQILLASLAIPLFSQHNSIVQEAIFQDISFSKPSEIDLRIAWLSSETPLLCGQYEKIELGIELPKHIDSLIYNYTHKLPFDKLNPFNPDDIDIRAEFTYESKATAEPSIYQYGFYYQDFERGGSDWKKIGSPYSFRVRISPDKIGKWSGQIKINIKGFDHWNSESFTFDVVESNLKGFVKVGENKLFFEQDGKAFFGIGQNLPWPKFQSIDDWGHQRIPPQGYRNYHRLLDQFAQNGGNYYRMLIAPWNLEIEFEEIGNYYDRLNSAWEMDQIINKSEALGLYIHLNMQVHYPFENANIYGMTNWDWPSSESELYAEGPCKKTNDGGYCYATQLGLTSPKDFLTDSMAVIHYKNRLRYMVARWGYSSQIAIFEILSEANNLGSNNKIIYEQTANNGLGGCISEKIEDIYFTDDDIPALMSNWHCTMTSFIKQDLKHSQHLLSVSYTGEPRVNDGDSSYWCPHVDIVSYNKYSFETNRNNFSKRRSKYLELNKPMVFSEFGSGIDAELCSNNIYWIKDVYLSLFSGLANTGLSWSAQRNENNLWKHYSYMHTFLGPTDFSKTGWENYTETRRDLKAEMLCMINKNQKRSIGIIHNATLNYYTIDAENKCDLDAPRYRNLLKAETVNNARFGNAIKLRDMERNHDYTLVWRDLLNNINIDTQYVSSDVFRNIRLRYPTLNASDTSLYMVGFYLYDSNMSSFDSIELSAFKDIKLANQQESKMLEVEEFINLDSFKQMSSSQIDFVISENRKQITFKGNVALKEASFFILNESGQAIYKHSFKTGDYEVELENALSGTYFLVIIKDGAIRYKRVEY